VCVGFCRYVKTQIRRNLGSLDCLFLALPCSMLNDRGERDPMPCGNSGSCGFWIRSYRSATPVLSLGEQALLFALTISVPAALCNGFSNRIVGQVWRTIGKSARAQGLPLLPPSPPKSFIRHANPIASFFIFGGKG